ncbi:hypothetical protein LB504_006520 [Fusarium proliferatum]|nr:hypothetical protein LB504_006520 [Fusarium proliferatum]
MRFKRIGVSLKPIPCKLTSKAVSSGVNDKTCCHCRSYDLCLAFSYRLVFYARNPAHPSLIPCIFDGLLSPSRDFVTCTTGVYGLWLMKWMQEREL